jgi:N-acetylneuraminate synthase
MLRKIAAKGKPVLLGTGASDMNDVERAANEILRINQQLVIMQCNTNYTAARENFLHINLRVLESYRTKFPSVVLGLSDHTPGHTTVLGAVTLGARVIEKHFTDDNQREGPDHPFSMTPRTWREMVDRTRELEDALGSSVKRVAENERQTVVVQRRCLRAVSDLPAGTLVRSEMFEALRPAPAEAVPPNELAAVVGRKLLRSLSAGESLTWANLSRPGDEISMQFPDKRIHDGHTADSR